MKRMRVISSDPGIGALLSCGGNGVRQSSVSMRVGSMLALRVATLLHALSGS